MTHRHKIVIVIAAIAMLHMLLVVLFGDNGLMEVRRLNSTHERLLKDNALLTQKNLQMYRSIDRLQNDPDYVENIARRELGMIRSNELIFKFKTDSKVP